MKTAVLNGILRSYLKKHTLDQARGKVDLYRHLGLGSVSVKTEVLEITIWYFNVKPGKLMQTTHLIEKFDKQMRRYLKRYDKEKNGSEKTVNNSKA